MKYRPKKCVVEIFSGTKAERSFFRFGRERERETKMDFKWDISRQVPSYTEPKFYTVSNNSHSVEKTSNPSCIYNVECSPAKKNTDWFTFTMKIDKAAKHDAWNSLGIIECAPGKRTHARQSGTYFFFY